MVKSLFKFLRNTLVNPFILRNYGLSLEDDSKELIKEEDIDGVKMYFVEKPPKRNARVDYLALSKGEFSMLIACKSDPAELPKS